MPLKIEVAAEVVANLKEGDEAVFRAVYDQLHKRIYHMLFLLAKDHEQAEELLQETFVSLWLNRSKLIPSQPLYPYVYLTARRLAIDHFRRKMTEAEAKRYLTNHLTESSDETEHMVNAADLHRFTEEAIKKLPKQQQTVFILSRNEGLSYDEIAERMQISRNTVKNHLVNALKALKIHFVKNNITYLYFLIFISY
ncbi:RNA polymerase sigma factor [Parapedobacter lycopersici]|uniref:RNA polymerase sigma factor n=1 Tax=Parapedobacter lycopersici TaxID=1864939 RepID=UPI00214D86A2|nr:RNA polymerase sigma-70 factor [Parapedobacter lycopersici]